MGPQRIVAWKHHPRPLLLVIPFVILLLCTPISNAQTPEPTPPPPIEDETQKIERVQVDLVTLTLTVTDLYGRLVSGLSQKDFTVYDNNKKQDITFFSDSDAPVSIGIIFDVSGSMTGDKISKARTALSRFINTSHPNDEYFLIAFNSRAQLLLDRTRDGDAVLQKLTLVNPNQNTALYDAVYLGIERNARNSSKEGFDDNQRRPGQRFSL